MKQELLLVVLGLLVCIGCMPVIGFAAQQVLVAGVIVPEEGIPCRGMVALWSALSEVAVAKPQSSNMSPYKAQALSSDCSFEIMASPGRYFLSAAIRQSPGRDRGPLRVGDLIFMSPDADGNLLEVEVVPGQQVHVGTHSSYWEFPGYSEEVVTGISGRLVDAGGQPVSGLQVQAFGTAEMQRSPLAFSPETGGDGIFKLHLEEGSYYLIGQHKSGLGIPLHGKKYDSFFGLYGGETAKQVKVKQGQVIDNLEIVIERKFAEKEE